MAVLSVDLAYRSWCDLGVVLLEQKPSSGPTPQPFPQIACEIIHWPETYAPPVVELALRLNQLCLERGAGVLMLDGPQAWQSDDAGKAASGMRQRESNPTGKTGPNGTAGPGTYERFAGYCLALYDALGRLGWQRLAQRDQATPLAKKILAESHPHAAWKSLGITPLPERSKCRVSHLAEAYAALTAILPISANCAPNHDQLQAIVGGLPGLSIERRNAAGARLANAAPRQEDWQWHEGFGAIPVPPIARHKTGQKATPDSRQASPANGQSPV
jgi:hypothetical protein